MSKSDLIGNQMDALEQQLVYERACGDPESVARLEKQMDRLRFQLQQTLRAEMNY